MKTWRGGRKTNIIRDRSLGTIHSKEHSVDRSYPQVSHISSCWKVRHSLLFMSGYLFKDIRTASSLERCRQYLPMEQSERLFITLENSDGVSPQRKGKHTYGPLNIVWVPKAQGSSPVTQLTVCAVVPLGLRTNAWWEPGSGKQHKTVDILAPIITVIISHSLSLIAAPAPVPVKLCQDT